MKLSLSKIELLSYISSQLNTFFPDKNNITSNQFVNECDIALDRLNYCFHRVAFDRYNKDGETIFNHLYSDHYLVFIWFLSNTIWKEKGNHPLASKLYYLNKVLHGFDCMFDTGLPDIFLVFHGTGTMLGKAAYDNYFVSLQGCTIGSHKGKYPIMGKGVALTAHSAIVGECTIGSGVSVSINTYLFQKNVPANSVVFTDSETGKISIKPSNTLYAQQFFNVNVLS